MTMPKAFAQFKKDMEGVVIQHDEGCWYGEKLPNVPTDECACDCYLKKIFAAGWFMGRGVAPKTRRLNETERNERPK